MTHKLTVVYGGQYGSEGKGDVCAAIARHHAENSLDKLIAIRVGGPNAGHTILDLNGVERKLQSVPVAPFVVKGCTPILGASAVILPDLLARELRWLDECHDGDAPMVVIDRLATVILPEHMWAETKMKDGIGSTGEGVGAATAEKVMRKAIRFEQYLQMVIMAGQDKRGQSTIAAFSHELDETWQKRVEDAVYISARVIFDDTVKTINRTVAWTTAGSHVVVEGTQGVMLSLNTSGLYPFCTSRDCTPEALLGQIGISDRAFDEADYVCVLRTFPIRVGGNSGPLPNEITWEDLMERTKGYIKTPERTTVTKKIRRIAEWDWDAVHQMLMMTRPTHIALTFLDYHFPAVAGANDFVEMVNLDGDAASWLMERKLDLGVKLAWVGVGPHKTLYTGL